MINLVVTDRRTGKDILLEVTPHDAQKLYKALREIFGDAQYEAQPGQLVTVPDVRLKVG